MSEQDALVQRWTELYGANRCLAREAVQARHRQDHVEQNFMEGLEKVPSNHIFQTTTAGEFREKKCPETQKCKTQHTSSVHLGYESKAPHSVTKSDYAGMNTPQFQHHLPKGFGENNFADFAPRYRTDNTTGDSHYITDFDGEKTLSLASNALNKSLDEAKFHKSTHFELGNHFKSPATETSASFRGKRLSANTVVSQDRSKSNVFKDGDYNMTSPSTKDHLKSTQKTDYARPEVSADLTPSLHSTDEGDSKSRTNFTLGYDGKESSTVYSKDFDTRLDRIIKPPTAPHHPCSKVMHEFPVFGSTTSVNQQEYVKHKFIPGRFTDLKKIEEQHREVAVNLGYEIPHKESVTTVSFPSTNPADHAEKIIPKPIDYHHLESNRALPYPLQQTTCSEAQHSYKIPIEDTEEYARKKGESIENRNARREDNKSTHYVAGYCPSLRQTEQMSEFSGKGLLDINAGKVVLPGPTTKGYNIIAHDSGEYYARKPGDSQQIIQQRNYLRNMNPRDTVNVNLRKAFLEYDKNLSGSISKDDLKTVCKDMEVEINESDLDDIIARCDLNGDGSIDYHEFALNLSRLQPPSVAILQGRSDEDSAFTSITCKDFKDPKDQRMDPKHLLAQEKDAKRFRKVEVQPSNLFQWDAQTDNLQSIKMEDYKEPENVLAAMYC